MIAIIDYGVGNLFSLSSSLRVLGLETAVTGDAEVLRRADRIILPGVGAFADAIAKLRSTGLVDTICEQAAAGKPLLGICLGMQLLFEKSYEYGEHEGLGLVPGQVVPLADKLPAGLKVPHIGWNRLRILKRRIRCSSTPGMRSMSTTSTATMRPTARRTPSRSASTASRSPGWSVPAA